MSNVDSEHWYPNPWLRDKVEMWPSVTTILGATVSKPAIAGSNSWKAARFAVAELDRINTLVADGQTEQAIALIAGEPNRQKDEAAEIGTILHRIAEALVKNQPISLTEEEAEAVDPFLETLYRFIEEMQPEYVWAEATVFHKWLQYAGTLDAGIRFPTPIPVITEAGELVDTLPAGVLLIGDYKSGKAVWLEASPQITAYGTATHMDIKDNLGTIVPMPPIHGGVVIHIRPEGYRVHGVRFTPGARAAWQQAIGWFRWLRGEAPSTIGVGIRAGGLRIEDMPGLNIRARNALALEGVESLAELEAMGESAFLALKHVGPAAALTARKLLALEGRSWTAIERGAA